MVPVFGCELSKHCSQILLKRSTNNCVYKNIMEYCPTLPPWEQIQPLSWQGRWKLVREHFSAAAQHKCWRHDGMCHDEHHDFNISGSPCPPWSRMGSRRGLLDERSLLVFIWCANMLATLPVAAVHENTEGFMVPHHEFDLTCWLCSCMFIVVVFSPSAAYQHVGSYQHSGKPPGWHAGACLLHLPFACQPSRLRLDIHAQTTCFLNHD